MVIYSLQTNWYSPFSFLFFLSLSLNCLNNEQLYQEAFASEDEEHLLPKKEETTSLAPKTTLTLAREHVKQTNKDEVMVMAEEDEFSTIPLSSSPSSPSILAEGTPSNVPVHISADKLHVDSATRRILELEDERNKIEADREHWRALAKKVSAMTFYFCHLFLPLS